MNVRRIIPSAVVLLATACSSTGAASRRPSTPSFDPRPISAAATVEQAGINGCIVVLLVDAPASGSASEVVRGADVKIVTGGRTLVAWSTTLDLPLDPLRPTRAPVRMRLHLSDLYARDRSLRPGSLLPTTAEVVLTIVGPASSRVVRAAASLDIPLPTAPRVEVRELLYDGERVVLRVSCANDNAFSFDVDRATFVISIDGVEGPTADEPMAASFAPGEVVELVFSSRRRPTPETPTSSNGDARTYRLSGTLQVWSPYGALAFPIGASGAAPVRTVGPR